MRQRVLYFATGVAVAAFVVLQLAAVELYLRNYVFDPSKPYVRTPGWQIVFHVSQEGTPGVTEDAHIRINRLGLRGDPPSRGATPSILAIGGSTTEDVVLNDADTWTGRLQSELRRCHATAWVGNAGKAGTNSLHHAMVAEAMVGRLKLDRVLVLLGLNDMLFDARIHLGDIKLGPDWDRQQTFMYLPPLDTKWYERSAAYQLMLRSLSALRMTRAEAAPMQIVDFASVAKTYRERRAQVLDGDWITSVPADLATHLARFRERLVAIVAAASKNSAAVTFITQPSIWKTGMGEPEKALLYAGGVAPTTQWPIDPRVKWYAAETMLAMLEAYNDVTREVCRTNNLTCIDLAAELPKAAANFYDDFHYSKAGAAEIGRIVARRIDPGCG